MALIKSQNLANKNKVFALIDCNNFYASCERVFNPKLKNQALVILSNNDGCVIARSNEAKALGIPMGEPVHKCKYLIKRHGIKVYSSNFALYGDMSDRVMSSIAHFAPEMEIYSVDEVFLSLDDFSHIDLEEYCKMIKTKVQQWTGIPISIGLGRTKTLAKAANHIAKKYPAYGGVFNLINHPKEDKVLESIALADIWGIGKRLDERLKRHYIKTALDFKKAPDEWIKSQMNVIGLRTAFELRGISCIDLEAVDKQRKSVACSRSFTSPKETIEELKEAISKYISRAAEKLRNENLVAKYVHVYIRTNKFKQDKEYSNSINIELERASAYTPALIDAAFSGLEMIFKDTYSYKKAGVTLSGLTSSENTQLDIFNHPKAFQKEESLMKAVDAINQDWGSETIKFAASGCTPFLPIKQLNRSNKFTSKWSEILEINAK